MDNEIHLVKSDDPGQQKSGRKRKRFAGSNIEFVEDDPWHLKFRNARLRIGITQRELAQLLGGMSR